MQQDRLFDRSRLQLLPLNARKHDLDLEIIAPLLPVPVVQPGLASAGRALRLAQQAGAARVLMMGAHVLRAGMQNYLLDMLQRGLLTCIAVNGACAIHDFEFALMGATTESVSRYIQDGQFGLWRETGRLNTIVAEGVRRGLGIGNALGQAIAEGDFPHKDISLFAAAWQLGVPVTVHVGIGYDIVCEHPNYDGAAWGQASYMDFLRFAAELEKLENGVALSFGSAVMAPEIFLKALAMARNAARSEGKSIRHFTTLVADLHDLPAEVEAEASKSSAAYYFRPWKTLLVRTVRDGGKSWYARGDHAATLPQLWMAAIEGGQA